MTDKSWMPNMKFLKKLTLVWLGICLFAVLFLYEPLGFGLLIIYVVLPLTLTVAGLWGLVLYLKISKPKK